MLTVPCKQVLMLLDTCILRIIVIDSCTGAEKLKENKLTINDQNDDQV